MYKETEFRFSSGEEHWGTFIGAMSQINSSLLLHFFKGSPVQRTVSGPCWVI